jgi:BirA family biotin operon repressor/biotin-[acetyl-CoA-carboxylase] ligase
MTMDLPSLPAFFRLIAYETIGSTNDEAKRLARAGAAEGALIWGMTQTAGRGRRGRAWVSPLGNLYLSLVLRPHCPALIAAQLGFVAALGLGETLDELVPQMVRLTYKWPNDLLVDGKKLAGILLETEMVAGDVPDFVVIGVGVNLASSPRDVGYPAISLAEVGAGDVTPGMALAGFARHFARWLVLWQKEGFAPVRAAWLARASGLGEPVRVRLEETTLDGRFLDLDDDGALLLEAADGPRRIAAGEIFPAIG